MVFREISIQQLLSANPVRFSLLGIAINYLQYLYFFLVERKPSSMITHLIIFHILYLMTVWSYIMTCMTQPGYLTVEQNFYPSNNERRRFCLLCNCFKPDRSHHCSACQKCILNMFNHQVSFNNCIGLKNKKMFLLFFVYLLLSLSYETFTSLFIILQQYRQSQGSNLTTIRIILNYLVLVSTLLIFWLIKKNFSLALVNLGVIDELQLLRGTNNRQKILSYNLGWQDNLKQIFGTKIIYYPIPIYFQEYASVDGFNWPTNQ